MKYSVMLKLHKRQLLYIWVQIKRLLLVTWLLSIQKVVIVVLIGWICLMI